MCVLINYPNDAHETVELVRMQWHTTAFRQPIINHLYLTRVPCLKIHTKFIIYNLYWVLNVLQ